MYRLLIACAFALSLAGCAPIVQEQTPLPPVRTVSVPPLSLPPARRTPSPNVATPAESYADERAAVQQYLLQLKELREEQQRITETTRKRINGLVNAGVQSERQGNPLQPPDAEQWADFMKPTEDAYSNLLAAANGLNVPASCQTLHAAYKRYLSSVRGGIFTIRQNIASVHLPPEDNAARMQADDQETQAQMQATLSEASAALNAVCHRYNIAPAFTLDIE